MPATFKNLSKLLAGAALAAAATTAAWAQGSYPGRPIRLVVSQAPGGSSDTIARLWAEHAGTAIGGTIVVEHTPGGGGTIAAQSVRHRPRRAG